MKHSGDDQDANLGPILFRCRPKPVRRFLLDINRKASHLPEPILTVTRACESLLPYAHPLLFAGVPTICMLGALNGIFGASATPWAVVIGLFAVALSIAIWWYWVAPRTDFLVVYENGFRWRIWLSKLGIFPNRGSIHLNDIAEFRCRSDWREQENRMVQPGMTTAEKMSAIIIAISCGKHELVLFTKDGKNRSVENILARFDAEDTRRFLDHVNSKRAEAVMSL